MATGFVLLAETYYKAKKIFKIIHQAENQETEPVV